MSAYMVDRVHIDTLVQLAVSGPRGVTVRPDTAWQPFYYFDYVTQRSKVVRFEDADELGAMLIAENLRSIHARYPDTIGSDDNVPGPNVPYWTEPYVYRSPKRPVPTAVEALKGLSCYEYQSCESDEWRSSEAKGFCDSLRSHLISRLPGYHEAAWSWHEVTPSEQLASWQYVSGR